LFIALISGDLIFPLFSEADSGITWVELAPTPIKRTEFSSALVGDKIYLLGGFTPKGISKKVDVWDIKSAVGVESFLFPVACITEQLQ
jgi:hypothetical protein